MSPPEFYHDSEASKFLREFASGLRIVPHQRGLAPRSKGFFLTFHRFGLLLAMLSVLTLSLSGYAPAAGVTDPSESNAQMMDLHDCCPEGSMTAPSMPTMQDMGDMPCPSMEDCANGPCGIASNSLAVMIGSLDQVRLATMANAQVGETDRYLDAIGSPLAHPPRA